MAAEYQQIGTMTSAELRAKALKFLTTKRKLDLLVEILQGIEVDDNDNYIPSLLAVELIFTELLKQRDMYKTIIPLKPEGKSKAAAYREVLRDFYTLAYHRVVCCMSIGNPASRLQALSTAMQLLRWHGKSPIDSTDSISAQYYFPSHMLQPIITALLSGDTNNASLIARFKGYLSYDDVLFYTWKILRSITPRPTPTEIYMKNYFELAEKLGLKKDEKTKGKQIPLEDESSDTRNLCETNGKPPFHFQVVKVQRYMSHCWSCIATWTLVGDTHRRALLLLLDRLLPNLTNPLLLTDFFMDSMDTGGAVSMLALQGVFTLIQQHHLDYPQVYTKLYSMFEPEIFHNKHKSRLFYLADMFLRSTHLPEVLVGGFVKRFCRLALVGPPADVVILMHFVANLLIRHPGLKRMAYREEQPHGPQFSSSDPYIMDERDPCLSNALQSSVWEAAELRKHVVPAVAEAAVRVMAAPNVTLEVPLSDLLDATTDDIFDKEFKKTYKQMFLNFSKCQSMSLLSGERLTEYWQLI